MEIIYENRKNMGIRRPEFAEGGLSEMGSMMDWGSPASMPKKGRINPRNHHARTKSSNMLEEGKMHGMLTHQFTLENEFDQRNPKLERMKRCESGLNKQRKSNQNWAQLLDFKSPDIRQRRDFFDQNKIERMMNKTNQLTLNISPESPSPMVSEITPYESEVRDK
jgi:hypothetical protein